MSRSDRIGTVLRVRRLQARRAEIETVQRRLESDRRRTARLEAMEQLALRAAAQVGSIETSYGLERSADIMNTAVDDIELRGELLAAADAATREAEADWLSAHRRQDAVERLAERHHAAQRVEETRNEQKELDDLVSVRHGRRGAST